MPGAVFDTGALVALERGHRSIRVVVAEARQQRWPITVPAGCVAQAWREPARQARLAAFLRSSNVVIASFDAAEARRAGILLRATNTSDVIDAHVALCAVRLGQAVFTSDVDDIRRLAPHVEVHLV